MTRSTREVALSTTDLGVVVDGAPLTVDGTPLRWTSILFGTERTTVDETPTRSTVDVTAERTTVEVL